MQFGLTIYTVLKARYNEFTGDKLQFSKRNYRYGIFYLSALVSERPGIWLFPRTNLKLGQLIGKHLGFFLF